MALQDGLSLIFLFGLFVSAIIPFWIAYRRPSDYSPLEKLLYAPVYCLGRVLWRVEVADGKTIAQRHPQGAIIVANHRCALDPFFIQLAAGRRVHWMVAGEYFRNPFFGPILRTLKAIPTNRSGADNAAMKTAMRLAAEGKFVGMFPEGRINRTRRALQSIRSGAGLVSMKSGAPLLSCRIEGAPSGGAVWSGLFTSAHVCIRVGEPCLPSSLDDNHADQLIVTAMRRVLELGGHDHEAVVLAKHRRRKLP
jgi:1-acyl-sn-glycerol-3-phosphate acyltransferase